MRVRLRANNLQPRLAGEKCVSPLPLRWCVRFCDFDFDCIFETTLATKHSFIVLTLCSCRLRSYLTKALEWLEPPSPPRFICIGGRSGTGKSTLAKNLAPSCGQPLGAVTVRTDEVRKRIFGVAMCETLPPSAYTAAASSRVYDTCFALTRQVLLSGTSVILDGTFLSSAAREGARALADDLGVASECIWLEVPEQVSLERVASRGQDVSDANASVVRRQHARDIEGLMWPVVDASGSAAQAVAAAKAVLEC